MNQFERMAAQRDELVAQAEALLTRAGDSPLEGEDREEFDRVTAEIESVNERHKKTSELDRLIAEGRVSYESGDGSVIGPQFQKRVDAWEQPSHTLLAPAAEVLEEADTLN